MRLNSKKCDFDVRAGKFLGFMVSKRGIEVIPRKYFCNPRYASSKDNKRCIVFDGKSGRF